MTSVHLPKKSAAVVPTDSKGVKKTFFWPFSVPPVAYAIFPTRQQPSYSGSFVFNSSWDSFHCRIIGRTDRATRWFQPAAASCQASTVG